MLTSFRLSINNEFPPTLKLDIKNLGRVKESKKGPRENESNSTKNKPLTSIRDPSVTNYYQDIVSPH